MWKDSKMVSRIVIDEDSPLKIDHCPSRFANHGSIIVEEIPSFAVKNFSWRKTLSSKQIKRGINNWNFIEKVEYTIRKA